MKRITSFLLVFVILLSIIYINPVVEAAESFDGYIEINTATDFKNIVAGKKYYLSSNIDLTASGVNFTPLKGGNNNASVLVIDGCGYTVTTNKPLIEELPGGGALGVHSEIRNLNINGNITVSADEITAYNNGASVGALVGKANGGIFKNIINNASVTVSGETTTRVGGIIGAVFNDDIIIEDCVNNGAVMASVSSTDKKIYGVGGIISYIGFPKNTPSALMINVKNTADVKNNSTAGANVYAGGITCVKNSAQTTVLFVDCSNTGEIYAKQAYGNYYAVSTYQNVPAVKSIPISSPADFANINGKNAYRLTADITLDTTNFNDFSGILIGNGHKITSNKVVFSSDEPILYDVDFAGLTIKGCPLGAFAIVAPNANDASAKRIVDYVKSNYGVTLSVKTPADNYKGNAIYINQNNTYGDTRYGFDYDIDNEGNICIYLDETADNIASLVDSFLLEKLTTTSANYDFYNDFKQKEFRYAFEEEANSQGFTFDESNDVRRTIVNGLTYLERTYTTSAGKEVVAYIVVLKKGAEAHFEAYGAPHEAVDACENNNSNNCGNKHPKYHKTTSEFAKEMEENGKNVLVAANAGFFMLSAKCYTSWGMQIVDGRIDVEPDGRVRGDVWFGVTKDGVPVISNFEEYESTYKGNIQNGIGGRYLCIDDGKYVNNKNSGNDARTAVGCNANGDIVMVAVAGNDADEENPGATLSDMAQIFMDLDMDITEVLNLDGGGSTTMIVDDSNNALTGIPLYSGTKERSITNIMVIVKND